MRPRAVQGQLQAQRHIGASDTDVLDAPSLTFPPPVLCVAVIVRPIGIVFSSRWIKNKKYGLGNSKPGRDCGLVRIAGLIWTTSYSSGAVNPFPSWLPCLPLHRILGPISPRPLPRGSCRGKCLGPGPKCTEPSHLKWEKRDG